MLLFHNLDETAFTRYPTFAPPPAPRVVAAHFLLVDEHHFQREVRLRQQVGDAYQFVENLLDHPAFGGFAAAQLLFPVLRQLDNPLFLSDGVNQPHRMRACQRRQLILERRETARLNLDQQVVTHDVDDEAIDGHFEGVAGPGIPRLKRRVERAFVPGVDAGGGMAFRRWGIGGDSLLSYRVLLTRIVRNQKGFATPVSCSLSNNLRG